MWSNIWRWVIFQWREPFGTHLMEKKFTSTSGRSSGLRFVLVRAILTQAVGWKTRSSRWSARGSREQWIKFNMCRISALKNWLPMVKFLTMLKKILTTSSQEPQGVSPATSQLSNFKNLRKFIMLEMELLADFF